MEGLKATRGAAAGSPGARMVLTLDDRRLECSAQPQRSVPLLCQPQQQHQQRKKSKQGGRGGSQAAKAGVAEASLAATVVSLPASFPHRHHYLLVGASSAQPQRPCRLTLWLLLAVERFQESAGRTLLLLLLLQSGWLAAATAAVSSIHSEQAQELLLELPLVQALLVPEELLPKEARIGAAIPCHPGQGVEGLEKHRCPAATHRLSV